MSTPDADVFLKLEYDTMSTEDKQLFTNRYRSTLESEVRPPADIIEILGGESGYEEVIAHLKEILDLIDQES